MMNAPLLPCVVVAFQICVWLLATDAIAKEYAVW
jgi:hypothetical protein